MNFFTVGLFTYLSNVHHVDFPPNFYWFCTAGNFVLFAAFSCSTLLILSMTFDRFFSIIRPHKAASFNTVKRAKMTISCIILFSILYNIPHLFISSIQGIQCLPYGDAMGKMYGELYYWLSFIINFALAFVLLLTMNSVIIYKLRTRMEFVVKESSAGEKGGQGQGDREGQSSKLKSSEKQVFVILLLVTFMFLVLTTPGYLLFLLTMVKDFTTSSRAYAGFYLYYNVAQKLHYTNHGINFFLYVISGQKFRNDLLKLFPCNTTGHHSGNSYSSDVDTKLSVVSNQV